MTKKKLDISEAIFNIMSNLFSETYNNKQKINLLLRDMNDILNTDVGILSKITNNTYEIIAASSIYNPGDKFDLKNTYCQLVSQNQKMYSITNIGESDCVLKNHPLYIKRRIETYLAIPVFINGEFYGTVNFSSEKTRDNFSDYEIGLSRIIADRIEFFLEKEINND